MWPVSQSFIDPGLKWSDIAWFKSITKSEFTWEMSCEVHCSPYTVVPIILKGVQCWEVRPFR